MAKEGGVNVAPYYASYEKCIGDGSTVRQQLKVELHTTLRIRREARIWITKVEFFKYKSGEVALNRFQ